MLDEPIDSVITDSIVPVQDSAERLASLLKEAASWKPMLPFDTLTNQVELVEGIPLNGEKMNIEFISSILIYTVIYLVFIALLRLRGRGFLTTVYTYFFNRKRETQFAIGRRDAELLFCFFVRLSFLLDLVYIVDFFNGSSLCILSCFNLFPDHFRLLLFSFGTCATFRMDI